MDEMRIVSAYDRTTGQQIGTPLMVRIGREARWTGDVELIEHARLLMVENGLLTQDEATQARFEVKRGGY